jgi:hypothetical protein
MTTQVNAKTPFTTEQEEAVPHVMWLLGLLAADQKLVESLLGLPFVPSPHAVRARLEKEAREAGADWERARRALTSLRA